MSLSDILGERYKETSTKWGDIHFPKMKGLGGVLLDVILFRWLLGLYISTFQFLLYHKNFATLRRWRGGGFLLRRSEKRLGRVEMYEACTPTCVTNSSALKKKSR